MAGIFGLLLQDRRHRLYWGSFGKLRQPEDAAAEVNLHDGAGLGGIHQDVIFHRRGGGAKETAVLFSLRHLLFNTWDGSVIRWMFYWVMVDSIGLEKSTKFEQWFIPCGCCG